MRFYLATLGCPKNVVDSEMMSELLRQARHEPVDEPPRADVLIVNTCAFIQSARQESYQVLRELASGKRRGQWLVAAGCLAQRNANEIFHRVPEIDAIIGTRSWPEIVTVFEHLDPGHNVRHELVKPEGNLVASVRRRATMGSTAYLKIADGCDAPCAFCAIPLIKGPQRSKPLADVVREAQELVGDGVREIVLIAQDTTAYGRDRSDPEGLPGLLRGVLETTPRLKWLRIMYTYPQHIQGELIETMVSYCQVCHYLDLPLQHGHPDVLRRMRRPSDVGALYDLIATLRKAMPDIALRSSFIVGYPGETEVEYEALLDFMKAIAFDRVGIFAYSAEEGTLASRLPHHVPPELTEERYEGAMLVQQEISLSRNRAQLGRELSILVEGAGDGISVGRSYRDAPEIDGLVLLPGEFPVGEFVKARVVGAKEYDLIGEQVYE